MRATGQAIRRRKLIGAGLVLACAFLAGRCDSGAPHGGAGGREAPAQAAPVVGQTQPYAPATAPPPARAEASTATQPALPLPGADPKRPLIREGRYVQWLGRTWSTRDPSRLSEQDGVGTLGQRNATGTYLGEAMVAGGSVAVEVRFDAGYLDPVGGGKHFIEIVSWLADRSDRAAVGRVPWSRIELDNLGGQPRCLVWNHGPQFAGRAARILRVGPAFEPDRWYRIRLDWNYREPRGRITVHIDDRSYETDSEFVPGTVGPGRFFGFGNVETNRPEGRMYVRHLVVRSAE
jgi:hypothetical protein